MIDVNGKIEQFVKRSNILFQNENPYIAKHFKNAKERKLASKHSCVSSTKPSELVETNANFTKFKNQQLLEDGKSSFISKVSLEEGPADELPQSHLRSSSLVLRSEGTTSDFEKTIMGGNVVARRLPPKVPVPAWHAPWELSAVISGHLGWVRSIAFEPSNEWFVTGSADRTIKVWDLAKCCAGAEGGLKLTLTGHINAVRGLAVSPRHPYLFSAGEDKMVKCWDLEYNKVIRHYHGHLSAVFCLALHPILDILITGGRDSVARVWDMRTKNEVHVLGGHTGAIGSICTNSVDPQVITGSHDSTIKLWDLAAGKAMSTLTQHKKAVRHTVVNPREFSFVSAGADNIKKWQCRDGKFIKNLGGHNAIVNCLAINEDGVMVSCGDNGSMCFWDYETGYLFQKATTVVQPGSLDAEAGIFAASFDLSGSRLITCEADKSIKIWKENVEATPESNPIDMKSWTKSCLALRRH